MNTPCLPFCGWELDVWEVKPRTELVECPLSPTFQKLVTNSFCWATKMNPCSKANETASIFLVLASGHTKIANVNHFLICWCNKMVITKYNNKVVCHPTYICVNQFCVGRSWWSATIDQLAWGQWGFTRITTPSTNPLAVPTIYHA